MELNVTDISYESKNEEGLSFIHFETEDGYFTVSCLEDEDHLYMELNDQSNGAYINPVYFQYGVTNGKIMFYVNENRYWNLGLYQNITLLFEPMELSEFKKIGPVVKVIFNKNL